MRLIALPLSVLALALAGCALSTTETTSSASGLALQGKVHGGQQPIVGAHVYLMQAGTSGSAGYGIPASSANSSVSLLNATKTGLSDSIGAYVLTANDGSFSIGGDYSCTPGTQVYLYVLGGNPGAGTNSAASLMAILGNCPAADNFAATVPYLWVNEVSTVAAAYAMAGYATDSTHVSSSGSTLAATGIQNAFANAANLVTVSTGIARTTNPANTASVPQAEINTLANILASCVNSSSSASSTCNTLFANALNGSAAPSDTASAAINIAHNPAANVANLYTIPTPSVAFAPALTTQPNDFSLSLTYTLASLSGADAVAIDATGDAWVANYVTGSVVKLSPAGASLANLVGSVTMPGSIAIDNSGNAWVASANTIVKVNPAATSVSSYTSHSGTDTFFGIAVDGFGDVWSADSYNYTKSALDRLSSTGSFFTSGGYTVGGLATPDAVAVDGDGNVWAANVLASSVSKLTSSGTSASGLTGFIGAGISTGSAIAIDGAGSAWVANSNDTVTKLSNSGTILSGSGGFTGGGLTNLQAIAIDGAGNAWVAGTGSLAELSNSGTAVSGPNGLTTPTLNNASGIAIDGSGNVWVANFQGTNGISELIGAAVPVVTPIAAGLPSTPNTSGASNLGTRP